MPSTDNIRINLAEWVDAAKSNPDKYQIRQVVEILLLAIGMTKHLKDNLYLKGGALMAIAHESQRMTSDIDYSWFGEPFAPNIDEEIIASLEKALKKAITSLGYLDLLCKVQSVKKEPRKWQGKTSYPSLNISIGYAKKGTAQEQALENNNASNVIWLEISFNETLESTQLLILDNTNTSIQAYSPTEIIAEKIRALLQQTQRKHFRSRRQDVYDIALLLEKFSFDIQEKEQILNTIRVKSESRNISVQKNSMQNNDVRAAAEKEWNTISLELEESLPSFDSCYEQVQQFYESLPWENKL